MTNKIFHWSEVSGNAFVLAIDPRMLLKSGYQISRKVPYKDGKASQVAPVIYDKSFILEKLSNDFFKPLDCLSQEQLFELLELAYEYYLVTSKLKLHPKLPSGLVRQEKIKAWQDLQESKGDANDEQV